MNFQNIKIIFGAVAVILVLGGCASLAPVKKPNAVALISVYVDSEVREPEESEGDLGDLKGTFSGLKSLAKGEGFSKAVEKSKYRPYDLAEAAPGIMYEELNALDILNVIPEVNLLQDEAYHALPDPSREFSSFGKKDPRHLTKTGWKIIIFDYGRKGMEERLGRSLKAAGLLYVQVSPSWVLSAAKSLSSTGNAFGHTNVNVFLTNKDGKKLLWSQSKNAKSDGSIGVVEGLFDQKKMDVLLVEAYRKALRAALADLKKKLEKTKS